MNAFRDSKAVWRGAARSGFTVLELLVAVAAIVIIGTVVVTSVSSSRRAARDTRRAEDLRQLRTALELYFDSNRRYPQTLGELAPNFIPGVPRDPGGNPYAYVPLGTLSTCGSYHLGANLETGHQVLAGDVDAQPAESCVSGMQDFSGKDVVSCGGAAGPDRCFDIVPELLAVMAAEQQAQQDGQALSAGSFLVTKVAGVAGAAGEHFTFSGGATPRFISADIQPRDVKVGDTQLLRATVSDADGIFSVIVRTELDHSVKSLALEPQAGAQAGCTECTWSISWSVNDTSNRTYHTIFTARSTTGRENTVTIAWTDPCSPPLGGSWTLDAGSCTFSGVNGVDGGNLTIDSGRTMTLAAGTTFAHNLGTSITFGSGGGSIARGDNTVIKRTNLWIKDADGDGVAPNTTDQLAQDTQPSTYRDRSTASGTADCDDAAANTYQTLVCYRDDDADTYTVGSATNVCAGATCGTENATGSWIATASGSADCYDANNLAKPGQTSYFTSNRGDGSFDYDCDSVATQQYTATNSCP